MTTIEDLTRQINRVKSELSQAQSSIRLLSSRVNNKNVAGESMHIRFGILDVLQTVGATVSIANLLTHAGEDDNFISFTEDQQEFSIDGSNLVRLKRSTQDLVEIGDVDGTRDVDVNLNSGQAFLQGSSGFFGVRTVTPDQNIQVGDGANSIGIGAVDNTLFIGSDGTIGRLILEGSIQADVVLIDGGAATDDKAMQLATVGGITKFRSLTDVAGAQADAILVMDHETGHIGIGTETTPRGGVGIGIVAIHGLDFSAEGPHMQFTTSVDNYPLLQILSYAHDNVQLGFDYYWDGSSHISSDAGSNFRLLKSSDSLYVSFNAGTAAGSSFEWLVPESRGWTLLSTGEFGVGVVYPLGVLHAFDEISGFLIWEYDGLDTTVRTIIPNVPGLDVLYQLTATHVLRDSAGATSSGVTNISNGSSSNLTVGSNTVRLRVNADGSTDIARTAGTDTIKVALTLRWL